MERNPTQGGGGAECVGRKALQHGAKKETLWSHPSPSRNGMELPLAGSAAIHGALAGLGAGEGCDDHTSVAHIEWSQRGPRYRNRGILDGLVVVMTIPCPERG